MDQANQNTKTNKKEPKIERGNRLCSDIPEWLQEFKENLEDDEIPERGDSHASSSHEVVVQDLATQWIQAYPCKNKNFSGNPEKLAKVLGTR